MSKTAEGLNTVLAQAQVVFDTGTGTQEGSYVPLSVSPAGALIVTPPLLGQTWDFSKTWRGVAGELPDGAVDLVLTSPVFEVPSWARGIYFTVQRSDLSNALGPSSLFLGEDSSGLSLLEWSGAGVLVFNDQVMLYPGASSTSNSIQKTKRWNQCLNGSFVFTFTIAGALSGGTTRTVSVFGRLLV